MERVIFSRADLQQIEALGISETQVRVQLEIFERSSFYVRLNRPCTLKDGVQDISPAQARRYLSLHEKAAHEQRFLKFVPASGAATRMFHSLFQVYSEPHLLQPDHRLDAGIHPAVPDVQRFIDEIERFAFYHDLEEAMARDGLELRATIRKGHYRPVIEYLLTDRGLSYGSLPKGLLRFHRYGSESRTAFEEHLVEAVHYVGNESTKCALHFTISHEHEEGFKRFSDAVRETYEARFGIAYEICFTFQKRSTDTIAVDLENRPFREPDERLLFRPGGHGALLENLNDLEADLVYIKNIDNLSPDRLKETTVLWKKILGGLLVDIEAKVHGMVRRLKASCAPEVVEDAERLAREELLIHFPEGYRQWSIERRREFMLNRLNRPIRVCGVVPNEGEPGGAPFWVENDRGLSIQIVEKAQVDFTSAQQRDIWMASTHFNPVDLVCSLRDYEGKPFDLKQFVDPDAVFISRKSKDGRELKALEHPGLWNGAMADWITVVVEVPKLTFNPVKTVFDLLRPEHQA